MKLALLLLDLPLFKKNANCSDFTSLRQTVKARGRAPFTRLDRLEAGFSKASFPFPCQPLHLYPSKVIVPYGQICFFAE